MVQSVMVLAGGLTPERDVSIRSGRRVAQALRDAGIQVVVRDLDQGLLPALAAQPPDCVIPMVHGAAGEDGSLREVLEALGLPYVGSRPDACRAAFDKMVARARMAELGVRTAPAVALPHATFRDLGATGVLDAFIARLGIPLVVKPTRGGSALGVSIVGAPGELAAAMVTCFSYAESAMLEQCVSGREVAISVIERSDGALEALPAVEIVPDSGAYDYASRYTAGATEFFAPARLGPELAAEATRVALIAHQRLGLRHLSRTDVIVDADGNVTFLEVNVAPGCTETSLLPQAVSAAGLDLGEVFAELAARAVREAAETGRGGGLRPGTGSPGTGGTS